MEVRKETTNYSQSLEQVVKCEENLKERKEFDKAQQLYSDWIQQEVLKAKDDKLISKKTEDEEKMHNVAIAYNNRGQLKYLGVDFDGAVQDYNKALEYDPELSSAYYNRGTILYRMGRFDMAILDFRKASQLSPEIEEFKTGLAKCQKELD